MNLNLKNKKVVILAASQGLGFAIAQELKSEGASLAICSSDEANIQKAGENLSAEYAAVCDLTKTESVTAFMKQAIQKLGGIDVLITNCGGPPKGEFLQISNEQWQAGFQMVWMSVIESMRQAAPHMIEQKFGRIIMVTSTAAKEPIAKLNVSNGLRAGLLGLMKAMSQEWGAFNITVNAVLPGYTETNRLKELGSHLTEIAKAVPMKRIAQPNELAKLVAFLSSESANYINGQAIACDGGFVRGL